MAIKYRGPTPEKFWQDKQAQIKVVVNEFLFNLESEAAQNTPSGISGQLRGRWKVLPFNGKTGALQQPQSYYLPVELGRKPGKGISAKGQSSVARWAKLKLGLSAKEAKSFAYLLSRKYKREGRKPSPILGLRDPDNPSSGGLLDKAFKKLDQDLGKL